jgi:hypothetical protein
VFPGSVPPSEDHRVNLVGHLDWPYDNVERRVSARVGNRGFVGSDLDLSPRRAQSIIEKSGVSSGASVCRPCAGAGLGWSGVSRPKTIGYRSDDRATVRRDPAVSGHRVLWAQSRVAFPSRCRLRPLCDVR